jgi:hypothetical protein
MITATSIGEASREVETVTHSSHAKPALAYSVAMRSWFIHEGQAHNVECCPPLVFVAWLASVVPATWTEATKAEYISLDESGSSDARSLGRWFSLNNVLHKSGRKKRVVLYASQDEAISSLK